MIRKTLLQSIKSPISKQTQSKTLNAVFVTRTDQKYFSQPLNFTFGLLAKHFMKREKLSTEDENNEQKSNKPKTYKKTNISKIIKNINKKITKKTIYPR